MKYVDLLNKAAIVKYIPLVFEGRKLPKGMNASVVMVRVQYEKYIEEFNSYMEKVSKELKKEGYDEKYSEYTKHKDVISRKEKSERGELEKDMVAPSQKELSELEKYMPTKESFEKEIKDFEDEYTKAYTERLQKEVDITERKFNKEELSEIVELIGIEGNISINHNDVPKEQFINTIAMLFTNYD